MLRRLLSWWRIGKLRRSNRVYRPIPCSYCGLCVKTASHRHGAFCLFFAVYIRRDQLSDANSPIRQGCYENGNHFVFRLHGVSPIELFEWRIRHTDWYLTRTAVRLGALIGVLSLLVAAVGLLLNS